MSTLADPDPAAQTWPRLVLAAPLDTAHARIVVADEENCTTGDHQVVVAWGSAVRPFADELDTFHGTARYPDVAVVGPGAPNATDIVVVYLGELSGGQQEVRVRKCTVERCVHPRLHVARRQGRRDHAARLRHRGNKTVDALAAPSIACDAGTCHVAWTEAASSGNRTRVFYSSSTDAALTSWSTPHPGRVVRHLVAADAERLRVAARRADIVYLDTRLSSPSKFDAIQTSIDGADARPRHLARRTARATRPARTALARRSASRAAIRPGATTGVVAVLPRRQRRPRHGLRGASSRTAPRRRRCRRRAPAQTLGKNTTFNASSLAELERSRRRPGHARPSTTRRTAASSAASTRADPTLRRHRHRRRSRSQRRQARRQPPTTRSRSRTSSRRSTRRRRRSSTRAAPPSRCRCTPRIPTRNDTIVYSILSPAATRC